MAASIRERVSLKCLCAAITLIVLYASAPATAQSADSRDPDSIGSIAKAVLLDPTTYAPAAVYATATTLDWNSSQLFFGLGFVEHNRRFTVSGRSDDAPISFEEGNRRIRSDTLTILQTSVLHNLGSVIIERVLVVRNPEHRKLITVIAWIERMAVGVFWSYTLSEAHWRQWRLNVQRASALGFP